MKDAQEPGYGKDFNFMEGFPASVLRTPMLNPSLTPSTHQRLSGGPEDS